MDASVEQLKRREEEEGAIGGVCVCIGKREEERGGESLCVYVCVWKKEAEPVNGELAGFLPPRNNYQRCYFSCGHYHRQPHGQRE